MKCIILAAGYATRLYPLTKNFPKPLLEVNGKTILNRLIEDIEQCKMVNEYIVVSNHKFIKHFQDWATKLPHNTTILDDGSTANDNRLGAVKDLEFAVKELSIDEDCLVIAGDNLLDFSLTDFILYAQPKKASCIMYHYLEDINKLRKTGVARIKDNILVDMEEKPAKPKTHFFCPPFYYFIAEDIKRVSEALEDGCAYDSPGSFPAWLCHKTKINALLMPGMRYDIGDIESYEAVKCYFASLDR
ncbi:MAG: NTP transferase domain-containing protein [Candidatus Saccharibacteria bacterium]|nr:NTP transferase domain-containing protein [Candidatus Saccharibacteria bacterium]